MLLMMGGFYFWEHSVYVLTIYGSSLINNQNVRRLFNLGASGIGSKVWVLTKKSTLSWTPSACSADHTCPSISDNPLCCPNNLKREKLCYLWTKITGFASVNFKSDDRFVVPVPNGRGSFEAWLTEAPISSHFLPFWKGVLGVLSRPWIGHVRHGRSWRVHLVKWSLTAPRILRGDDTEEK